MSEGPAHVAQIRGSSRLYDLTQESEASAEMSSTNELSINVFTLQTAPGSEK